MVGQDVILGDREIPVEDLEKLSFDPSDIAFAKDTGAQRPMNVSESRIVSVLGGCKSRQDETTKRNNGSGEAVRKLTLAAKISAPRNTRSQAHCSVPIERQGFARWT